eukprot:3624386-Pleurochrysis_carterae.AAC.1
MAAARRFNSEYARRRRRRSQDATVVVTASPHASASSAVWGRRLSCWTFEVGVYVCVLLRAYTRSRACVRAGRARVRAGRLRAAHRVRQTARGRSKRGLARLRGQYDKAVCEWIWFDKSDPHPRVDLIRREEATAGGEQTGQANVTGGELRADSSSQSSLAGECELAKT